MENFDQEKIVQNIRKKEGNQFCADCHYPSPSWSSLDFGILICYECSGNLFSLFKLIKPERISSEAWTKNI